MKKQVEAEIFKPDLFIFQFPEVIMLRAKLLEVAFPVMIQILPR